MKGTLAIAIALALGGCPPPVCFTGAMRCDGELVQACDSRGQWRLVVDCADVARSSGSEWSCSTSLEDGREVNTCLPAGEQ